MFEQATIPVQKEREFQQLRTAIDQVFSPERADKFLSALTSKGIRVRQFDRVLSEGLIEKSVSVGASAKSLYEALTMPDQAQIREFYLERLEKVSDALRAKFSSIYRYE